MYFSEALHITMIPTNDKTTTHLTDHAANV